MCFWQDNLLQLLPKKEMGKASLCERPTLHHPKENKQATLLTPDKPVGFEHLACKNKMQCHSHPKRVSSAATVQELLSHGRISLTEYLSKARGGNKERASLPFNAGRGGVARESALKMKETRKGELGFTLLADAASLSVCVCVCLKC